MKKSTKKKQSFNFKNFLEYLNTPGKSKIIIIRYIILTGFIISILYHYILSLYGFSYPYNTFLFIPDDRFNDFFNVYNGTKNLDPYGPPLRGIYYPFSYMIMYFFTLFPPMFAFSLFIIIFIAFFAVYVYRNLSDSDNRIIDTFIFTIFTYPFLDSLDRANMECLLFIFLGLFVYFYQKKDDLKSIIFLSITIALKLYTGVFVILYLADRKYKNILFTGFLTIILTVLSACLLHGGMVNSFTTLLHNQAYGFKEEHIVSFFTHGFSSSLYSLIRIFLFELSILFPDFIQPSYKFIQDFTGIYFIGAFLFFIFLSAIIVKKDFTFWEKISLLTFLVILLPVPSYDYKLIYIFIPLFLYINYKEANKNDMIYTIIFGLLLIPQNYYQIIFDSYKLKNISISVLLHPLLILVMLILILKDRLVPNKKIFPSYLLQKNVLLISSLIIIALLTINYSRIVRLWTIPQYFNYGNDYMKKKDYSKAIDSYTSLINLYPYLDRAYIRRGTCYGIEMNYDKVIKDYTEALKLNPVSTEAYTARGFAYTQKEEYKKAIENYKEAFKLDPSFLESINERAMFYVNQGEYEKAIYYYTLALNTTPDFVISYYNGGAYYFGEKKYEKAIDCYNKVLKIKPRFIDAYLNRANAYAQLNQNNKAIEDYTSALKLAPDDTEAYNNRAKIYSREGKYDKAIEDCSKILKISPECLEAYNNRGYAYSQKGEYERAIADFNMALKKTDYFQAYYNRGNAYLKIGNYDKAIEDYNFVITINSNYAEVYNIRGYTYAKKGDYDKAIKDYDRALKINPDYGEAYYNRKIAFEEKEKQKK